MPSVAFRLMARGLQHGLNRVRPKPIPSRQRPRVSPHSADLVKEPLTVRLKTPVRLVRVGATAGRGTAPWLVIGRCLAVVTALAVGTAGRSHGGTVLISDFTSGAITAQGNAWVWTSGQRTLTVGGSNTSNDYLELLRIIPAIDITGGTALRLTGSWFPNGDSGSFLVDLLYEGTLVTRATLTFDQFASGPKSLEAALSPLPGSLIDQWQLVGNGSSAAAFGDLELTGMSVVTVPEPATNLMALTGLAWGGFLSGRGRWRARRGGEK